MQCIKNFVHYSMLWLHSLVLNFIDAICFDSSRVWANYWYYICVQCAYISMKQSTEGFCSHSLKCHTWKTSNCTDTWKYEVTDEFVKDSNFLFHHIIQAFVMDLKMS